MIGKENERPIGSVVVAMGPHPAAVHVVALLTRQGYTVQRAETSDECLSLVGQSGCDLAVVASDLPPAGLELVRKLSRTRPQFELPIVVIGYQASAFAQAQSAGADAFFPIPFAAEALQSKVQSLVVSHQHRRRVQRERDTLRGTREEQSELLTKAMTEISRTQHVLQRYSEEIIFRLSKAVEYRDDQTGNHVQRVSRYCGLISRKLGLGQDVCEAIRIASALHDVGKIATPDDILHKPTHLSDEEMSVMRRHAGIGYRLLTGSQSHLLDLAAIIAWTHHERFDGTGYPRTIKGKQIPVEGRIAAVADVFDALTSKRVYKPAMTMESAIEILKAGTGSHFDPLVVNLFLENAEEVRNILIVYADR